MDKHQEVLLKWIADALWLLLNQECEGARGVTSDELKVLGKPPGRPT